MALLGCVSALVWCGDASARDLSTALGEAESRVEAAALEVSELKDALRPTERQLEASAERAAPAKAAARAAAGRLAEIEREIRADRLAAASRVSRIEEENRNAADKHDEEVRVGLGIGLAALIAAYIAFAWGWFRASALVAWLTRIPLGQAIGICVGGGLLMVIVGAAMANSTGIVGVIGFALFALGFILANALVLARHSAEVQRGRSKPVLRRERLPRRITLATGGVLAALCLIGLGSAVFAGETESTEASAELRREAMATSARSPALAEAERDATKLDRRASLLLAAAGADRRELRATRRKLGNAEARLASAEGDADSFTRRLAALSAREEREAQAEALRAEEEAEEQAAEECHPSYSGCLDPSASDYDCEGGSGDGPLYTGTVEVVGYDEYGLDDDGDGVGCEL